MAIRGKDPAGGPARSLTANGAALLGLLAIQSWPRPWTTYELAKQSKRSLHWFWPRAERQFYDTPKKLVAMGYATAREHATGKRPSTLYEITPEGREALRQWLDREGNTPLFEIEQLIRVFFAEQGDVQQLRTTLTRMEQQAITAQHELADIVRGIEDRGAGNRAAVNALSIKLVADLQRTTIAWTQWAKESIADWDSPQDDWAESAEVFAQVIRDDESSSS